MGFHKRRLPDLKTLKETLERLGADVFYKIYIESPDAVIGETDSFEFVEKFKEEYEALKVIQEKQ